MITGRTGWSLRIGIYVTRMSHECRQVYSGIVRLSNVSAVCDSRAFKRRDQPRNSLQLFVAKAADRNTAAHLCAREVPRGAYVSDLVLRGDAIPPPSFGPPLAGHANSRWSGNVAGGIDSAPQPQPHVCRAAMIPKPCWPYNGFSAVTRKPLPTTRRDVTEVWARAAGRLRMFRCQSRAIFHVH